MKTLPATSGLLAVAERVVWFKTPAEALANPVHFLAHVMTYGTPEDLRALQGWSDQNNFRETLENAPPGVFDPRSWAYWNLKCGRVPVPLYRCARESDKGSPRTAASRGRIDSTSSCLPYVFSLFVPSAA
jgi:hypothetical protein